MATRAFIGIRNGERVKYIYLHFDGYMGCAGRILDEFYKTRERIEALLELGDLSILRKTPEECVSYARDMGGCECPAKEIYLSEYKHDLPRRELVDFVYWFEDEKGWFCKKQYGNGDDF